MTLYQQYKAGFTTLKEIARFLATKNHTVETFHLGNGRYLTLDKDNGTFRTWIEVR